MGTANKTNIYDAPHFSLDMRMCCHPVSLLPSQSHWPAWLTAGHGPSGWETAAPSGPCSPPAHWHQSPHLRLGSRSCIQKCQFYHMIAEADLLSGLDVFKAFVCALQLKLSSLPCGCSTRLRVMIWRIRVETDMGSVKLDSCPSPRSVRVLSPELPSDWSRDSSSL